MRILGFGGAYPEQDEAVDPHRFIWSQRLAVNAAIALVIVAHAAMPAARAKRRLSRILRRRRAAVPADCARLAYPRSRGRSGSSIF